MNEIAVPASRDIQPVGPSLPVRIVLRPMTKVLNPVIVKFAGRPRVHVAGQIRHTGRRSGKDYVTPVSARRTGDVVLIALTFGNQSDWSRNVVAAGGGSLRLDGIDYDATAPEIIGKAEAEPLVRSAFTRRERAGLRVLGIRQFMRLNIAPADA